MLQRFHTDPEFRETVRLIARGLDLQVFELARDVGLAVVNIAEGPYAPTLDDFRKNMGSRERITYGLLLAMLTAYVYPSRRAIGEFDDSSVVSIDLRSLVEWASTASRQMKAMANLDDVANADLRAGFDTVAVLEPFGDGQNNLHYRFRFILEWLAKHGLFLCREEGGRELWVARPHFRIQARHLMQSTHDRLIEFIGTIAPSNPN
ncbi:MAG TPA: hypothetical protein PKX00_03410 [Opitutaceae bacterium]|nr:hypothetical protein [Opitutaceae bacterium]